MIFWLYLTLCKHQKCIYFQLKKNTFLDRVGCIKNTFFLFTSIVNKDENVHIYAIRGEKDEEKEIDRGRESEIDIDRERDREKKIKKYDTYREKYAVRGEKREVIKGFCEKNNQSNIL